MAERVLSEAAGIVLADEIKACSTKVGDLATLATTSKTDIVSAVNEVKAGGAGNSFTIEEHDKTLELTDASSQETVKMFKSTQAGSEVLMYQNINSGGTASIALPTLSGVATEVNGMFQSYNESVTQPLASRVSTNETAIAGCYTKAETDAKIADELSKFDHLDYEIVAALPATGEAGVRYLVKHPTDAQYEEYIYVNNTWNDIGSTDSVDLSSYYNKTETDALLDAQKVTVDDAMSDTSENPVQNKAVKAYVDTIDSRLTDAESAITTLQTAVRNLEDSALPVDTALSATSVNPVQNKAISEALNNTSSYTLVTTAEAEAWFN